MTIKHNLPPNVDSIGGINMDNRYVVRYASSAPKYNNLFDLGSTSLVNATDSRGKWNNIYGDKLFGTSFQTLWADVAEIFKSDMPLAIGTLASLGGELEVTATRGLMSFDVVGVVSENPAFLMNSGICDGVKIALMGQVPCRIIGTVKKGERIVTSRINGVGASVSYLCLDRIPIYCVVGRALEDKNDEAEGLCRIVVGVK